MPGKHYSGNALRIDGNWPRHAEMNLPLPPDFRDRPVERPLLLTGRFRCARLFGPARGHIRERAKVFVRSGRAVDFRPVVVLGMGDMNTPESEVYPAWPDPLSPRSRSRQ